MSQHKPAESEGDSVECLSSSWNRNNLPRGGYDNEGDGNIGVQRSSAELCTQLEGGKRRENLMP